MLSVIAAVNVNAVCVTASSDVIASNDMCATGFVNTSDERLKKDITNYRPIGGLACSVMSLRAVEYKWKDPAKSQKCNIGFIAQEVEKVIPSAVSCSSKVADGLKDRKGVNYNSILAMLLELSKEHQIKIEKLEEEVKSLKEIIEKSQ